MFHLKTGRLPIEPSFTGAQQRREGRWRAENSPLGAHKTEDSCAGRQPNTEFPGLAARTSCPECGRGASRTFLSLSRPLTFGRHASSRVKSTSQTFIARQASAEPGRWKRGAQLARPAGLVPAPRQEGGGAFARGLRSSDCRGSLSGRGSCQDRSRPPQSGRGRHHSPALLQAPPALPGHEKAPM